MTVEELCSLLADFQERTKTIRGRRVNQGLIFINLDADGRGLLEAHLEQPGHGTDEAVHGAILADELGIQETISADFEDIQELEKLLRGEQEPDWAYDDE